MLRLCWVRALDESCFQPAKAGHQEHEKFMLYVIVQNKKSVRFNTNATSALGWAEVAG